MTQNEAEEALQYVKGIIIDMLDPDSPDPRLTKFLEILEGRKDVPGIIETTRGRG